MFPINTFILLFYQYKNPINTLSYITNIDKVGLFRSFRSMHNKDNKDQKRGPRKKMSFIIYNTCI